MIETAKVLWRKANCEVSLAPLTCIAGPMFAGKTSIVQGIESALDPSYLQRRALWKDRHGPASRMLLDLRDDDGRRLARAGFMVEGGRAREKYHDRSPDAPVVLRVPDLGAKPELIRQRLVARFADPDLEPFAIDQVQRDVLADVGIRVPQELDAESLAKLSDEVRTRSISLAREKNAKKKRIDGAGIGQDYSKQIRDTRALLDQAREWKRTDRNRAEILRLNERIDALKAEMLEAANDIQKYEDTAQRQDVKLVRERLERAQQALDWVRWLKSIDCGYEVPIVQGGLYLRVENLELTRDRLEELVQKNEDELASLRAAPSRLKQAERRQADAHAELNACQRQRKVLKEAVEQMVGTSEYDGPTAEELEVKLANLETKSRDAASLRSQREAVSRLEMQHGMLSSLLGQIRARYQLEMQHVRDRCLATVNRFAPEGIEFDMAQDGASFGVRGVDGRLYDHLSGGQEAALQKALLLAWGHDVEPDKRLVLLDDQDFAGLSADGVTSFLRRLTALQREGVVAQVICTRHNDRLTEVPKEYRVVDVTKLEPLPDVAIDDRLEHEEVGSEEDEREEGPGSSGVESAERQEQQPKPVRWTAGKDDYSGFA